jgi:hypothetical protein
MKITFSSEAPEVLRLRQDDGDVFDVLVWAQSVCQSAGDFLRPLVPEGHTVQKVSCTISHPREGASRDHTVENTYLGLVLAHTTPDGAERYVSLAFSLPILARRNDYQHLLELVLEVYTKHCVPIFAKSWEKWNDKVRDAHSYGVDTNFTLHANHYTSDGTYDRTLIEKMRQIVLSREAGAICVRAKWGYDPDYMGQPEESIVVRFSKPAQYEIL